MPFDFQPGEAEVMTEMLKQVGMTQESFTESWDALRQHFQGVIADVTVVLARHSSDHEKVRDAFTALADVADAIAGGAIAGYLGGFEI